MSFRKRNLVINRGSPAAAAAAAATAALPLLPKAPPPPPGVRPSPINGQPTTSTGTPSLDALLAGHAGLPLGCSLLVEEPGTTDFGGALLRYYAAEGIVQGHAVTVVGFGEAWARDLPAVTGDPDEARKGGADRMKIAWRYEKLGEFGSGIGGSRAQSITAPRVDAAAAAAAATPTQFCHSFDLTKRLALPADIKLAFIPAPAPTSASPFTGILSALTSHAAAHPPTLPHRVLLPSFLSPLLYPPSAAHPSHVLPFLRTLRALLRRYPQMTIMASVPLELYPRDTGLMRWAEILADVVLELTPLPRPHQAQKAGEEPAPQGLVKLWKVPGGGKGVGAGEDLAFTLTRKRFEIKAYSLPPADDGVDHSDGAGGHEHRKATKVDVEF